MNVLAEADARLLDSFLLRSGDSKFAIKSNEDAGDADTRQLDWSNWVRSQQRQEQESLESRGLEGII